ncbi:MAG: Archaeal ATPase [Parachlamydiales bacterium]|nr:Archaeal ATPase [Parachlamydiales bacterium]
MSAIFARVKELKMLERILHSRKPEFLAVYGRRRVGKTFLIREFFKTKGLYFALTGVKNAKTQKQLKNFAEEFSRVFKPKKYEPPKDWFEAFSQLRKAIESRKDPQRVILFLDELPWLATPRSGFLEDLDHFWNRYMSEDNRIILIVCGSAASWMIKKVVHDKGGLHGRLTADMRLLPFDLRETEEFLKNRGVDLNRKAVIDIYMAIGGIPKYLNYISKGQSALQVVNHLCFDGPLEDEFEELYSSLFENHERHVSIIKALAERPGGMTKTEMAKSTSLSAGGGMNMVLEELEQSGFVLSVKDFGKQKKESRYRLVDEYSLFHLKWLQKSQEINLRTRDDKFWMNIFNSPMGQSWAGYAFEILCLKHLQNIKDALGITGVLTNASGWCYKSHGKSKERGVQIDLLIDRADNCINLCEIKYCNDEFLVNKACDKDLREKKSLFIAHTKTRKSVFLTLIAPYGTKQNVGYFDTVDVSLTMDSLFS